MSAIEITSAAGSGPCEDCASSLATVHRGSASFCGSCATRRGLIDPEVLAQVQAGIALALLFAALERQHMGAAMEAWMN